MKFANIYPRHVLISLVVQCFLTVVSGYNLKTGRGQFSVPYYTRATDVFVGDLVVYRGMEEGEARAILKSGMGGACPAKFCYASNPQLGKGTYATMEKDNANIYASYKDNHEGSTFREGLKGVLMKFTIDRRTLSSLSLIDATSIKTEKVTEKRRFEDLIGHDTGKINSIDEVLLNEQRPKADLIYQSGMHGTQNQIVFRTAKACNSIRYEQVARRPVGRPSIQHRQFGCSIM